MTILNSHPSTAARGALSEVEGHRPNTQGVRGVPWKLGAGVLGVLLVLLTAVVGAAGRAVSFPGPGGRTISGLVFEASARPASAVVMLPMLGRPKDDWAAIGDRFASAGITALAIDLPGLGAPGDAASLTAWGQDAVAAVAFLASRPADVRPGSIGLMGASLGANLAAVAAAGDGAVRSLALVSPSLDYRGVRIEGPMRQYGGRPALLIASLQDPYAARSVRELASEAPGPRQMRWSDTGAHGTVLLARDPDLVRSLIEWFQLTLG
jgi:dienelactone hydrolase